MADATPSLSRRVPDNGNAIKGSVVLTNSNTVLQVLTIPGWGFFVGLGFWERENSKTNGRVDFS